MTAELLTRPVRGERRGSGDPGLFGPDSVTWRVHGDVTMLLAGLRALYLQALHPLAMAGVEQHSGFRTDPWGRLGRTGDFIGVVTFGTRSQAERAAARVRGIHRRLRGVDPDTGAVFRIDDPDLLLWVHVSEVESFLSTYVASGGPASPADCDRYFDEQRRSAELMGLDPRAVPGSRAEVTAYYRAVRPELRATRSARRSALFVLVPPMPTWLSLATPARPGWLGLALTAFGLLPPWARRLYGLPALPTSTLASEASARILRATMRSMPVRYREGPRLVAARRRLGLDDDG